MAHDQQNPHYNPHVAFGLKALTVCMKAKGGKATKANVEALITDAQRLLPTDADVADAVGAFAGQFEDDQNCAAEDLHAFLSTWRDGIMRQPAERAEEALRDMAPAHFDWQDRKDCGDG